MIKMFVFWLLLQPLQFNAFPPALAVGEATICPTVTDLQMVAKTANSYSFSWTGHTAASQYEVWYVRESDGYRSPSAYLMSMSHTFNNLSLGSYTFYVRAICDSGPSGFIGIEDLIEL